MSSHRDQHLSGFAPRASVVAVTLYFGWRYVELVGTPGSAALAQGAELSAWIVAALVFGKIAWLFLPTLFVERLAARLGAARLGRMLFATGFVCAIGWLSIDLWTRRRFGGSAAAYLPMVADALRWQEAGFATQWAGDARPIAAAIAAELAVTFAVFGAFDFACRRTIARLAERPWSASLRRVSEAALVACVLVALVPLRLAYQRTDHSSVAYLSASLAGPDVIAVARRTLAAFGLARAPVPLAIVSLVPDPYGTDRGKEDVTLLNYGGSPIELAGLTISNRAGASAPLEVATLAPHATLTFRPSAEGFTLDNAGDELTLRDATSEAIHRVAYAEEEVRRGGVLHVPAAATGQPTLQALGAGLRASYASLHGRAHETASAPATVSLGASARPHVVVLVLESFRHDSVSDASMPALSERARSGTTFAAHYAATNTSHLGLFALLYGESPLAFDPLLDRGVRPTATRLFRSAGYRTMFVTSGDCSAWRRMGEFLGERSFDEVVINDDSDWEGWRLWPEQDRTTLDVVARRLASATQPTFATAFLMSTHFPYAYPPEDERFLPAGDVTTLKAVRGQATREELLNRYRNTLGFLDRALEDFFRRAAGPNTIVVVTGDHGESIMDDGTLSHGSRSSEMQFRTPLVAFGPGIARRRYEGLSTHPDVLPTLLHWIAGETVPLPVYGRDLLADGATREHALFVPYYWRDPFEIVLASGTQRLLLRMSREQPELEAMGFLDSNGRLQFAPQQIASGLAEPWPDIFTDELTRAAR